MKKPIIPKKERMLYVETARQRVAEVLFKYPEKEFSLSDLAKEAGVRKSNIGKILDDLHHLGFIQITKLSKIWRIKANQTNPQFIKSKIAYNLGFIYQSGLIEFLEEYFKHPKSIILFGSFRKGEDVSTSDIDIAIESEDYWKRSEIIELKELLDFEKKIGRKIQIHLFSRARVNQNVYANLRNGIVLSGFLESAWKS